MKQRLWDSLSFFEQLSNIDGEVTRLVNARERYKNGEAKEDYSRSYIDKIKRLIKMTFLDPKNSKDGYKIVELWDELDEIERYLNDEVDADYITRYWHQYTDAIS